MSPVHPTLHVVVAVVVVCAADGPAVVTVVVAVVVGAVVVGAAVVDVAVVGVVV